MEQYAPAHLHSTTPAPPTSARKRGTSSDHDEQTDGDAMIEDAAAGSDLIRKKSGGTGEVDAMATVSSVALPKYAGASSAIVNVYHDGEALKMFDTVEFFGVLAVASLDASVMGENDGDGFNTPLPPASAVPRFHAITYCPPPPNNHTAIVY